MRLVELDPRWMNYEIREEEYERIKPGCDPINFRLEDIEKVVGPRTYYNYVERKDACGITFLCPVCFKKNNGRVGTHQIICWDPSVPQHPQMVGPGRWHLRGDSYDNLTLVGPTTSSILLQGGDCGAHFHITNGEIVFC